MRRPSYPPSACWSCQRSRSCRESSLSRAKCSIRRAGGTILIYMESVLAFWVTEVLRTSFVSLHCARCATPLLRSQFIPIISKDPTINVVNFARTRMWFVPGVSFHHHRALTPSEFTLHEATCSLPGNYEMAICVHSVHAAHPSFYDRS